MPKRVAMAGALDRLGVLRLLLEARARAVFPWRWITVLTFHRVARADAAGFDREVIDTSPEEFERQVATLKRYFTLVDTTALDAHHLGAALPANPAIISFDDGYRDNHDVALPILRRQGVPAVFFVATGYVGGRRLFWWERVSRAVAAAARERLRLRYPEEVDIDLANARARRAATARLHRLVKTWPGLDLDRFLGELEAAAHMLLGHDEERRLADELIMSWDQVRALKAAGMDVQSHTRSHRVLQTLSEDDARADLEAARFELEEQIEGPVSAVAYPSGQSIDGRPALRRAVRRAGYRMGLTSNLGVVRLSKDVDWLNVPRIAMLPGLPEPYFRGCLAVPALSY